ncbi:MAG: winged helix-turn-helix transcriptional regulator [Candidatus Micrarchaeota archaeon]|nr:winged helix-turn-helix transcriptional regulator [Candidatus Micrarchaeota archaeon]MDE1834033.1 winged helix-turn-helix transcriptional regulator [Candidatus Micrarchaeota archaeon]MDE1859123.1 winged helix-turn-helix transcriptional regulator [Candidatus Micrarchaeota archaeon]
MDVFSAIAEPRRRKVIEILAANGSCTATQIYEGFEISPQAVSQHLGILRDAGVVIMEKRAQQHIYRINPDSIEEIEDWTARMTKLWNRRFDELEKLLEREQKKNANK